MYHPWRRPLDLAPWSRRVTQLSVTQLSLCLSHWRPTDTWDCGTRFTTPPASHSSQTPRRASRPSTLTSTPRATSKSTTPARVASAASGSVYMATQSAQPPTLPALATSDSSSSRSLTRQTITSSTRTTTTTRSSTTVMRATCNTFGSCRASRPCPKTSTIRCSRQSGRSFPTTTSPSSSWTTNLIESADTEDGQTSDRNKDRQL